MTEPALSADDGYRGSHVAGPECLCRPDVRLRLNGHTRVYEVILVHRAPIEIIGGPKEVGEMLRSMQLPEGAEMDAEMRDSMQALGDDSTGQ